MPISKILPDGRVEIFNSKTGETKAVAPEELGKYNPAMIKEYQGMTQATQAIKSGIDITAIPQEQRVPAFNQAQAEGFKPVDPKKEQEAQSVLGLIEQLKQSYNQADAGGNRPDASRQDDLSAGQGNIWDPMRGVGVDIEAASNKNVNAKTYKRLKEGFTSSLKELTGDTGVLTDQDYVRLASILPSFSDSDAAALDVWKSIDKILINKFGKTKGLNYAEEIKKESLNNSEAPQSPNASYPPGSLVSPQSAGLAMSTARDRANNPPAPQQPAQTWEGNLVFGKSPLGAILSGRLDKFPEAMGQTVDNTANRLRTDQGQQDLATGFGQLPLAGVKALKGIPGLFPTVKGASQARDKAVTALAENGKKVGGEALQKIAQSMIEDGIPSFGERTAIERLAKGEAIDPKEAIELLSAAGRKTFTKGGDFKSNQASDYYKVLREGIREQFSTLDPEVIKQTSQIAKAKGVSGFLKRMVFPTAVGAGVGIPISMGITKALGGGR